MVRVNMKDLRGAAAMVGKDGILNCVHLEICENGYRAVATDGYKMGIFASGEDLGEIVESINIPVEDIKAIATKVKVIAVEGNRWVPCTSYGVPEEDLENSLRYFHLDDREYVKYEKLFKHEKVEVEQMIFRNDQLIEFCNAIKKAYGKGETIYFDFSGQEKPVHVSVRNRNFTGLIMPCAK